MAKFIKINSYFINTDMIETIRICLRSQAHRSSDIRFSLTQGRGSEFILSTEIKKEEIEHPNDLLLSSLEMELSEKVLSAVFEFINETKCGVLDANKLVDDHREAIMSFDEITEK